MRVSLISPSHWVQPKPQTERAQTLRNRGVKCEERKSDLVQQQDFRMTLDFTLSVYFGVVIVLSTHTSLAHSVHSDLADVPEDGSQGSHAEERLEDAFEEQGYYLERLFLEYGSNGTLTYDGLQNLLGSLGLGEVSVLEIRHGVVTHSSPNLANIHQHLKEDHHHHPHPHLPSSTQDSEPETFEAKEEKPTSNIKVVLQESPGRGDDLRPESSLDAEKTLLLSDHPTKNHLHENCLNVTQLLWNFGLDRTSHITPAHFTFLCPALLYQIDSGVCLRHTDPHTQEEGNNVDFLRALGWASLALVVISLPSLVALGLTPLIPGAALRTFLCPMAAMAVGTLCGDALLHLLPHVSSSATDRSLSPESGHGHSHAPADRNSSSLSTVAWMVIMGDGIHNLTDGLAIGVAFSQSLTGGLSTTIAVFCHELPHELGDLAVLLAAGWPLRRLALFSLLSALLGYVGVLTGTVLGHHWAQHSPWILTLTAGMPEMLHGDRGSVSPFLSFFLQSVGLLTGGAIMLCIALFEENIAVNLGDG
ncbi:Zinc transporter ZIP10 [Bagarius yarrelli]|uniref:Zinc transporter ZIP10 n=1 Tax=Bagarius yarrelli TaxID=175774 RepID=A0A556UYN9_BAGYA|nr:Zinc transporter ZIP10 [Bagarius yarrelli]